MSEPSGWDRLGALQERTTKEPREPLCVATLILSCVPLVGVLALPLGFTALKRTRRDLSEGSRLAIIGMSLATLWLFTAAVLLVQGAGNPTRDEHGRITAEQQVDVRDLKVGDCPKDLPADKDSDVGVDVRPCSEPHQGEVFAALAYTDPAYPGTEVLEAEGDAKCDAALDAYVGGASDLGIAYYYPSATSWDQRDRALVCVLDDQDGSDLTGTKRDSGGTSS